MTVEQWRGLQTHTIRNMLGLARTAYLNLLDPAGKRKNCQRILAGIRKTRPPIRPLYHFWLGEAA